MRYSTDNKIHLTAAISARANSHEFYTRNRSQMARSLDEILPPAVRKHMYAIGLPVLWIPCLGVSSACVPDPCVHHRCTDILSVARAL